MIDLWTLSPADAESVTSADIDRWVAAEGRLRVYNQLGRVRHLAAYMVVGAAEVGLDRLDDARLATRDGVGCFPPDSAGLRRALRYFHDIDRLMRHVAAPTP